MNQLQRTNLQKAIYTASIYYNRNMPKDVLNMYCDILADLDYDRVMAAITEYSRNPKNIHMFNAAQLRAIIDPQVDPEIESREAAARITQAIVRFGHPSPKQAREFIGEAGWLAVERFGGWSYICENHGVTLDPTQFHAQARDVIKGAIKRREMGIEHQAPSLGPSPKKQLDEPNAVKDLVSNIFEKQKKLGL